MPGIYIHIPFCKQACHYCDFHFSTSLKKMDDLVKALCTELLLRKEELTGTIETIYFGGGTPSLLSSEEMDSVFETIYSNFHVAEAAEITLEANPDDLSQENIEMLAKSKINRLSIGVQSFFQEDLVLMNRAHNVSEAKQSIVKALKQFDNISIDLIYGIPGMSMQRWQENLDTAIGMGVPHLSCYALTVEPKTALEKFIDKGIISPVSDVMSKEHYDYLLTATQKAGFDNYEFSNFGRDGYYSKNNTAYWKGKHYVGIGPSAHSFNGVSRSWNINNNTVYIKKINEGLLPNTIETLSKTDRYNEYIMTGLRTKWGVSFTEIRNEFGTAYADYLDEQSQAYITSGLLLQKEDSLIVTTEGKFLSDGIASDLFFLH